jgi:hypothetical protein
MQVMAADGKTSHPAMQDAAGDRVTLQLEGGAALRVRLTLPPPGTAAVLAMVNGPPCMPTCFNPPAERTIVYSKGTLHVQHGLACHRRMRCVMHCLLAPSTLSPLWSTRQQVAALRLTCLLTRL